MSKKVLIFSIVYLPFFGGAEIAIKEVTDRVKDVDFDLITLRFNSDLPVIEKIGNVTVYRIGFAKPGATVPDMVKMPLKLNKPLYPLLACAKALSLHRKNKYAAIWAIMAAFAGFAAVLFKMLNSRVSYLLTLQEGDPIDYILGRIKFVRPLFNRIFTKADYIQPISTYLADWARQMGYKGMMKVIPNAVDTARFSQVYADEQIKAVANKLGKRDGDTLVITTSRLVKKNALDDVIKSLAFLPAHIKFAILGIGPDEAMLKELAREIKVENRVLFLGHVDQNDLPLYLQAADIFIRPSLSEGLGNSFLEAMAAGLPVIATPVGGIIDFLFDPEKNPDQPPTGIFCQVRDPQSIAGKIKLLTADRELKERIIINAKKLVFAKYDWNIIASEMAEIFHQF